MRFVLPRALAIALALPSAALAGPAQTGIRLVPHRAVYDLALQSTKSGTRAVEDARGRIAFDLTGNACDGYGLKFRQVTVIEGPEGGRVVSDLRTASFESGDGQAYRFRNDTTTEGKGRVSVDGSAEHRADGPLAVRLTSPKKGTVSLDGGALFPNAQMRDLIAAARAGQTIVSTKLFDGSDDGRKVFETLAVIGERIPGGRGGPEEATRQPGLANLDRWPVTLSYFTPERGDREPFYVLGFELYENGVSRALRLDYGDFVLKGDMTRLELLPEKAGCQR